YPYDTLASKVLGFTGGDNQGIIGLEVMYENYMKGNSGKILTLTDAKGVEIENAGERRQEPIDGCNLHISLDYNIQMYCEQAAKRVQEAKQADSVSVIVMNPQNGEIMAMVNIPEFHLNEPFTLVELKKSHNNIEETAEFTVTDTKDNIQDLRNKMWRNQCINDTYEPGSIFKIITAASALEEKVVTLEDTFYCPGYKVVEDRRIHCHKVAGHGSETFTQGIMNSCNPVFIELGLRLGVEPFYKYLKQFGLLNKTGIDLPGEAATIMHKPENVGLAATASSLLNGGRRITPHFGVSVKDNQGNMVEEFQYPTIEGIVSSETSSTLQMLLEKVVAEGSGKNAFIEGYHIGGKTATSQTLPRSAHKYISSFLGFAPADDPQILALVIINNPQGVYYGSSVAAPVVKDIFSNVLPYLGLQKGN
ncbi:MAG: penicillin-binding transpeptidase domain-containing protein, partial [Lachnospiraceae bacterium]